MFADVTSANIVGYMNCDIVKQNNLGAAPFLQVSDAAGMDIQKIIPIFADAENYASGDIQIKTLLASGKIGDTYMYLNATDAGDMDGDYTAGWFNEGWDTRLAGSDAVVFGEGEGFIIYSNMATGDVGIQYAGQVASGKITYEIGRQNNLKGNVTPIVLDIQNVKVGDDLDGENNPVITDNYASGDIQIKTKQASGKIGDTYMYLNATDAGDMDGDYTAGWFNEGWDTRLVETDKVEFAAGKGFIVYANMSKAYVQVPSAL